MANEWNVGKKVSGLKKETEYAVVVGLVTRKQSEDQVVEYLDELEFLALTAGAVTRKRFVQKLDSPDNRTFVGSGKANEIARYVEEHEEITMVIFDDDLSGKQVSILEEFQVGDNASWLVYPRKDLLPFRVRLLIEHLTNAFAD